MQSQIVEVSNLPNTANEIKANREKRRRIKALFHFSYLRKKELEFCN
jgi:hypothetical protein